MKYTLWFYSYDDNQEKLVKRYDVFTGTRSQCYKTRATKNFSWQYKVHKNNMVRNNGRKKTMELCWQAHKKLAVMGKNSILETTMRIKRGPSIFNSRKGKEDCTLLAFYPTGHQQAWGARVKGGI